MLVVVPRPFRIVNDRVEIVELLVLMVVMAMIVMIVVLIKMNHCEEIDS